MHRNLKETLKNALKPRTLGMFFLGFSAGLPNALIFATLSFWLARANINITNITLFFLVGLLFAVKWTWAPMVDQVKLPFLYKRFGLRRSWLLVAQISICCSLLFISFLDPNQGLGSFVVLVTLLTFSAATQDISIDAYRIECAPKDEQGVLAASYIGGWKTGAYIAVAVALFVSDFFNRNPVTIDSEGKEVQAYDLLSWQYSYRIMAGVALIGIITTLFLPKLKTISSNRDDVKKESWLSRAVIAPFLDFFGRFGKLGILIIAVVCIYRIADIVLGVVAMPFYVKMGYTGVEVLLVSKTFGMPMTLAGAALGGVLVSRFGTIKILFVGAILAATSNLLFAGLAQIGHSMPGLYIVIAADNISAGIATAAFVAFLSGLTSRGYTATQYALLSSLMIVLPKFVAGFSGFMVEAWGYSDFFIFTALLGIPTLILLFLYMGFEKKLEKK